MISKLPSCDLRRAFARIAKFERNRNEIKDLVITRKIRSFVELDQCRVDIPTQFWLSQGPECFNFKTDFDESCAEIYLPHLMEYILADIERLKSFVNEPRFERRCELSVIDFEFPETAPDVDETQWRLDCVSALMLDILRHSVSNMVVMCRLDDVEEQENLYRNGATNNKGRKRKDVSQEFWIEAFRLIYNYDTIPKQIAVKHDMNSWCIKQNLDREHYSETFVDDKIELIWRSLKLARNKRTSK